MWKEEYKKEKFYWGIKPTQGVKEAIKYASKGVALDIGAGEGRNSIFLAQNGFKVEAVDEIKQGLSKCQEYAEENNLEIKTKVCDIRKFKFKKDKYSLILSIASLDFLKQSEILLIIKKIKKSLITNGIFYLSVFSTKDPLCSKIKKLNLKEIEKNTFYLPKYKTYRHFFEKQELKEMFKDFKIINLEQKEVKDTGHGQPHKHDIIELIARKMT